MVAAKSSKRRRVRPSEDGILDAAEQLFAERGFGAPSLRDLLAAAGVSTTAFYARFESKEAVLAALIEQLFAELGTNAANALGRSRSMSEGFEVGVDVLVATVGPRKGLVRLALTEGASVPGIRERLAQAYAMLAGLLEHQLQAAHVEHARELAWALVGAVEMQVRRWAVFGDLSDDALDPMLRATARALLIGMQAGSRTGADETSGSS